MSLEIEKEQVVQALCAHYAQDHLTTGELESRFERANQAASSQDLRTVLEGLPALGPMVAAPDPLYRVSAPATALGGSGLPAHERRYVAFFAEVKKEGAWTAAPLIRARALFGSVHLDFREAMIPPEGLVIDVDVMLGDCKILLPPGLGAEVDCSAVMGSVNDKAQRALPGAPVILVRGSTFMGEITVQTKLPKKERMESWRKQLKSALFGDEGSGKLF
jgi:hypothetical protein